VLTQTKEATQQPVDQTYGNTNMNSQHQDRLVQSIMSQSLGSDFESKKRKAID